MLDTTRWKIPSNKDIFDVCKKKFYEKREIEPEIQEEETNTYEKKGSYYYSKPIIEENGYQIYVSAFNWDNIFIEFSAPKVMYGTNIFMLYPDKIVDVLQKVKHILEQFYEITLPDPFLWILQRLDICYAWKLLSNVECKCIITNLSSYEYPRKKKILIDDESLTYWGNTYKLKFYQKQPEFKAHDFKDIRKIDPNFAYKLHEFSEGIFRTEVTMHKKKIQQVFGEKDSNYTRIRDTNIIEDLLKQSLSELVKTNNYESMDMIEVFNKLQSVYDKKKAINLFQFVNTWYCADKTQEKQNRIILEDNLTLSTVKKRLDLLKNADIGIINTLKDFKFDLKIPSNLAVNAPDTDVMELLQNLRNTL